MNPFYWPAPPIDISTKREIPEKFTIFGTPYKILNGNPVLDIPSSTFDKNKIKNLISESFESFIDLTTNFSPETVNKIVEIHTKINEILNFAKQNDTENLQIWAKNKKVEAVEEICETISTIIN